MTTIDKLKNALIPSAISGGLSVGAYYFLVDSDLSRPLPLLGTTVPTFAAVGVSSFVGALAGEFITGYVAPMLGGGSGTMHNIEEMIIPPAMAGAGTVAAMKLLIDSRVAIWPSFLVGAVGEVGAKYIYGYA